GVGRQLYPELDLWATAAPFLERWLKKQVGVKAFLHRVRENIPYWSEKLPEIPGLIYDVLNQTREQNEYIRFNQRTVHVIKPKKSKWRYFLLGLGSAFLLSGLIFEFYSSSVRNLAVTLALVGLAAFLAALV